MSRLLRFQFRKIVGKKSLYICTIIMIALIFMAILAAKLINKMQITIQTDEPIEVTSAEGEAIEPNAENDTLQADPDAASEKKVLKIEYQGYDSLIEATANSMFITILSIFIALAVCEDFEQRTIRNIYSRGYSRKEVYYSGAIVLMIITAILFAIILISAFIIGSAFFGVGSTDTKKLIPILCTQLLICFSYVGFVYMISSFLRKNGGSIASAIIGPEVIRLLLSLADSFLKIKKFNISDYWISSFNVNEITVGYSRITECAVASVIYLIVFLIVGEKITKKKEV